MCAARLCMPETWALLRGPDAAAQLPCALVASSGDVIVSFDQEMSL